MNIFNHQIFKLTNFQIKIPACFIHLFFILFFLLPDKLPAQTISDNIKFKHLSVNDGLSDNNVGAILQDKEGFMWLGTSDGLNKYDGYKFTVYHHNPNDSNSIGPGNINSIYEDTEGLIWIGAEGSLSVLNKKTGNFKVYKSDPKKPGSLNNDLIIHVNEDKDGIIWISTYGGGLNKFDKKTGKFFAYKNDPKNPNSIDCDFVLRCIEDQDGILWIAAWGSNTTGFKSFDKKSEKFTNYKNDISQKAGISVWVYDILKDTDGIIWVGNHTGGLSVFDKQKKTVINQFLPDLKNKNSISNSSVTCMYDDSKGFLWTGTFNGLNILNKNTGNFTVIKNDANNSNSISNNHITKIYKDNQGLVWVGTGGGGVNIYDSSNNNFTVFKNNPKNNKSLRNNQVTSIYQDLKDDIWMGTKSGGLTKFDKTTGEFDFFTGEVLYGEEKIPLPSIGSIQQIDEHHLWLGLPSNSIMSFDFKTLKFEYPPSSSYGNGSQPGFVFSLLADSKKTLWTATPSSLDNLILPENKIIHYKNDPENPFSITENFTFNLFEDSQSNVWVSTRSKGLNVFERTTGKFYSFKNDPDNPNSINNDVVNITYQAPNGVLWLGTNGGGLNALILQNGKDKFTSGYKFYHFTEKDGLPNNVITGILPDDCGNLWISTNHGLCKFYASNYLALTVKEYLSKVISDIQQNISIKKDTSIYKNYDINDGLPGNSFLEASCKTKDGLMYFGNADGLLSFHPDSIKDNTHKPPVYFTSFKIFEKEFPLDTPIASKREIVLSYEQSFFSFEFVALDYAQPSKNQYAFMMEGFDSKWIDIGNRRYASYTNLDPGEYVFRVKASNNSGVWNEEGTSVRIIITPPFWQTKTFYGLCILSVIFLAYTYIKWRERKLRKEKRILENQVTMRTKELVEANSEIVQKNHEITDSINYARRIQQAILPDRKEIYKALPQSFILYKPKDIVSGDFYFFNKNETNNDSDLIFIAAADCTGHGVPGAFMSMIGTEKLHDAAQQSSVPGEILMLLNKGIKTSLHQSESDESTRDGMDIALCCLNFSKFSNFGKVELQFAGANRPIWIIRKGQTEIEEIKATKNAIGGRTKNDQHFETQEIQLQQGDTFYIFTDGFADQFGGEKGKKFTTKKFKNLLLQIQNKSSEEQKKVLSSAMDAWSLNNEQVDDILVIGVKI